MIQLNIIEEKFLEIFEENISLEQFEDWLYRNEEIIVKESSADFYSELLLINFKSKEAKHELAKVLKVDFEKLELYQIQQLIASTLLQPVVELSAVQYDLNYYEPFFICYSFKIGHTNFYMHSPFEIKDFSSLSDQKKATEFEQRFGNPLDFLNSILAAIGTKNLRIWNFKKYEQMDSMTEHQQMRTKEDEYKLMINRHYCHIKKEYIKSRMKHDWS